MIMTCAMPVLKSGIGWNGQLGIYDPIHEDGHKKLNDILKNQDKLMQIAKRACVEAHAKHTWDNRSYQLIELINQ